MHFTKMQGLGNDFILIDGFQQELPEDLGELAQKICHRQFGVGADGLVLMLPSDVADIKMRIFNPDGSEPEMCGNAIRCFAKYVYERGLVNKSKMNVETLAGIIKPELIIQNDVITGIQAITGVRVDMGQPRLNPEQIPVAISGEKVVGERVEIEETNIIFTAVSMGNPHCVIFVDDVKNAPVKTLGPKIETHPLFPAKTNVEFIEVINRNEVNMRVWERGAGETLACGTGACAVGVACVLNDKTDRKITVHLTGGDLEIEWSDDDRVFMTGPAQEVFEGQFFIK